MHIHVMWNTDSFSVTESQSYVHYVHVRKS